MQNFDSIVISSRVRLARNLAAYPFPNRLKSQEDGRAIVEAVKIPMEQVDPFQLFLLNELSLQECEQLKENYLISQKLIDNREIGALFLSDDEKVAIMVNEEDHVRAQYFDSGFCLLKAYGYLSEIDDVMATCVRFAYDQKIGYLTACPTNVGTGLRASVMVFLPGMTKRGLMPDLKKRARTLGLTVRGVYGEGSKAEGYMYQVSNEVTLGFSEGEIIKTVNGFVEHLAELEIRARKELHKEDPMAIKDACGRAYGILSHCYRLGYDEFLTLVSDLKIGTYMGLYDVESIKALDDLIFSMRDSNIKRYFSSELSAEEILERRAERVRERIKEIIFE